MKTFLSAMTVVLTLLLSVSFSVPAGFDQYGYNDTARVFVGTGSSWCEAGGQAADCLGIYSNDQLVMKSDKEWDRGNAENWSNPPYNAWTDNEWNGAFPGGSGEVWHYKIVWVGPCTDGTVLTNGGYCIWGQLEVIMDQGTQIGSGHFSFALATPNGYGAYFSTP